MPAVRVPELDKTGFVLFGTGLATLTYSLSAFSESIDAHTHSLVILCLSIVLLLLYRWHSQKQEHPIVNILLLRKRTFRISVWGNLCARLSFGGVPFLLPLLFQMGLKISPQLSGLLLTPMALGVFMVKPMSVKILRLLGYKKLLVINTTLVACILCLFSLIDRSTSLYTIGFYTFLYGFVISLQYTGMNSLAYANLDGEDLSAATSIMSTVQQLALSFGVAFAAILVSMFSPAFSTSSENLLKTLHQSFISMGVITLLSILIFLKLKPDDGQELINNPHIK
jgi:predicted MFS family arabinose efflux permease